MNEVVTQKQSIEERGVVDSQPLILGPNYSLHTSSMYFFTSTILMEGSRISQTNGVCGRSSLSLTLTFPL